MNYFNECLNYLLNVFISIGFKEIDGIRYKVEEPTILSMSHNDFYFK